MIFNYFNKHVPLADSLGATFNQEMGKYYCYTLEGQLLECFGKIISQNQDFFLNILRIIIELIFYSTNTWKDNFAKSSLSIYTHQFFHI